MVFPVFLTSQCEKRKVPCLILSMMFFCLTPYLLACHRNNHRICDIYDVYIYILYVYDMKVVPTVHGGAENVEGCYRSRLSLVPQKQGGKEGRNECLLICATFPHLCTTPWCGGYPSTVAANH